MQKDITKKLLNKVVEDYNKIASDFDMTRQRSWPEFKQFNGYVKNGDRIADIGCGNGRLFGSISMNKKIDYVGIDNSTELLKAAKKNFPEANFIKGNLTNIPLEDISIDMVTTIASFHHLPSKKLRKKSLKEINRILKKNGILIMTNWNLFQEKYKKYIWKARLKHLTSFGKYACRDTFIPWRDTGIMRYYYAFTNKELRKLLFQSDFEIIKEEIGRNFLHICKKKQ